MSQVNQSEFPLNFYLDRCLFDLIHTRISPYFLHFPGDRSISVIFAIPIIPFHTAQCTVEVVNDVDVIIPNLSQPLPLIKLFVTNYSQTTIPYTVYVL
jgi:hypothetical protein